MVEWQRPAEQYLVQVPQLFFTSLLSNALSMETAWLDHSFPGPQDQVGWPHPYDPNLTHSEPFRIHLIFFIF